MIDIKRYKDIVNEATMWEINIDKYVFCGGNFKGVIGAKNKYAKIINVRRARDNNYNPIKYYTLEFEEPIIKGGVETKIIEISSRQIKNLTVLKAGDYERKVKLGYILYECSNTFKRILQTIGFNTNHRYYDISYLNDHEDSISFLSSDRNDRVPGDEKYTSNLRQNAKVNKVLKKLNDKYSEAQIQEFGNKFKATWKILNEDNSDKIKVVTGDLITFWYKESNYKKSGGTLNNSCMRHERNQEQVKFYAKHPDKIGLCILLDENKKLLARALIWKLDEPKNVIFMDRIYYVDKIHEIILENYANRNDFKTKIGGYSQKTKLIINLPFKEGEKTPYFDTIHYDKYKDYFTNR